MLPNRATHHLCVITVIKSAWSFTHIFTSKNSPCGIVSKMNEHRLFILINTSYMILLVILLAKLSRLFSFCQAKFVSSEICVVLQWNSS